MSLSHPLVQALLPFEPDNMQFTTTMANGEKHRNIGERTKGVEGFECICVLHTSINAAWSVVPFPSYTKLIDLEFGRTEFE
eukprot:1331459-Amorphochlora_amoeboformis.AAC.1